MDVHKDTIVIAVTAAGDVGKATAYGTIPNTAVALDKLVKRLRQAGSDPVKFYYEAGPPAVMAFTAPSPGWVRIAWWWRRR